MLFLKMQLESLYILIFKKSAMPLLFYTLALYENLLDVSYPTIHRFHPLANYVIQAIVHI